MSRVKIFKMFMLLVVISFVSLFHSSYTTPLIDAVNTGRYTTVESLLKSGVSIDEQDAYGSTATLWALMLEDNSMLRLLLRHNPNLNIQNKYGTTAMMVAVKRQVLWVVELLLAYNPDLNLRDIKGDTALMIADEYAESGLETALKIVQLLSSKMKMHERRAISKKSCFVSFEQNDWNGVVAGILFDSLSKKIVSIVVPQLLKTLFKNKPAFKNYCKAGKITFFASRFKAANNLTPQYIVVIPASLDELGIKITGANKQAIEPSVDLSSIENKFGFKNLHLINPAFVIDVVEKSEPVDQDKLKNVIENFSKIIYIHSPQHPTRFYLIGHGGVTMFASIPVDQVKSFFTELSLIGAQFVYINSCYAAMHLPEMQRELEKIISKQITEKEKTTRATIYPGIDYAIVIQATADVSTLGLGDIRAMFATLDKFLQNPVWALTFGPGVEKPDITISDVIDSLNIHEAVALPSIRMPGRSNFFRSVKINNTKIITASYLIEKGVKRTLELLENRKSSEKHIADEAETKLKRALDIEILIKPNIKFIQIFPIDLSDFTFVINGFPKFISKLTGRGHHFIGKIVYTGYEDFELLVHESFFKIFELAWIKGEPVEVYRNNRCWFIKSLEETLNGKKKFFKKLVINLYSSNFGSRLQYAYINEKGQYEMFIAGSRMIGNKQFFESTARQWFEETIPSQETLTEATGGVEITAEEKLRLEQEKGGVQALRLLEPRFARTPQDLFAMFMAD